MGGKEFGERRPKRYSSSSFSSSHKNDLMGGKEHGERRRKRKGHNRQVKRQKKKKRYSSSSSSHNNSHLERLPDDILVHILSLMPTKDCVKSSILGKRWKLLWARVPNLKLDSEDHKTLRRFSKFVKRFVFKRKGHSIHTFSIKYYDQKDIEYKLEIERLIATAIGCNVQVIQIGSYFDLVLPQCLFTCKTLVDLTLNCSCCIRVEGPMVPIPNLTGTSSVVYLPALKKLQLDGTLSYVSEESFARLLSGCPALEELTIYKEHDEELTIQKENDDMFGLHISSPTLTRLHLFLSTHNYYSYGEHYEVKLDTPALEYLKLRDSLSRDFSVGMLASLTEADVDFDLHDDDVLYARSVLEFVGKLNNVSSLKLSTRWEWVEVPDSAFSTLTSTEFRNLTKLDLDGDLRFLTTFLQNSDNLQALTIKMDIDEDDDEPQYWMEPKRVPECLMYHLRTVRFEYFECSEAEINTVEYILRNAKVLKTMEILSFPNPHRDVEKESEDRKRISLFERASEACEVVFKMEEVCL